MTASPPSRAAASPPSGTPPTPPEPAMSVLQDLAARYGEAPAGEVDLRTLIARHRVTDDDTLAEVIEADARQREAAGLPIDLGRYLDAVPGLAARLVPLDTAIEYSLKLGEDGTPPTPEHVEALVKRFPDLEGPIREAALLSDTLARADESLGPTDLDEDSDSLPLPRGFGPPLPTGRPRYFLKELLGRGSHGAVYLAVDRQLSEEGRPARVAIKVLADEADPAARRRLIEEAAKARRVEHVNVVRVLDRGRTRNGEDYLVFEYVQGGSLEDRLRNAGPTPPADAARLVAQVARGVQAAHSAGLVHCDLKPANIMLTPDGTPKVADFGVAVRSDLPPNASAPGGEPIRRADAPADDESIKRTSAGPRPIGNLAFISPEQYRCEPGSLAPPSDVYSLGGILFYLLTRVLPNGPTPAAVAQTHAAIGGRQQAPSARRAAGSAASKPIDADLDAICARALAPNPAARYGSADALANDLEAWLRHEPIAWTRPGPWRLVVLFAKRQPLVVLLIVLLVVLGLAVGFAVGFHIGRSG